ncbi:tetratricopeptide repeat protein [Gloeocapsopsis sp. IPPAS B-1203]|uniref:tetratricopeptide repeat protein n=1 Tax=Gloeocapsopsis sp. IPPAS B-1203 TaxID=2049454 RepID=UPI0025A0A598|nr:tetratricopeptide repeat protein [Gloeocapsopsis sp. IPPAS B-1203]
MVTGIIPHFIVLIISTNIFFGTPQGIEELVRGECTEAIHHLSQVIQYQDHFAPAYSNRCLAYLQLEQYHQAIQDCRQATILSPHSTEAYLHRGLAYYRLGNYSSAIASYNQLIEQKPHDFRAYYNRGIALSAIGNYKSAIAYNQALCQIPLKGQL